MQENEPPFKQIAIYFGDHQYLKKLALAKATPTEFQNLRDLIKEAVELLRGKYGDL